MAHIVKRLGSVRSGHTDFGVPPVLEGLGVLVEPLAIEFAVVFQPAGDVPALAADILD